jgi:streptogramin lyase
MLYPYYLRGLSAGPDGSIWFSARQSAGTSSAPPNNAPAIGRLSPSGELLGWYPVDVRGGYATTGELTLGADGNIWTPLTDNWEAVARITSTGQVTVFPTDGTRFDLNNTDIASAPGGELYITGASTVLGRITLGGAFSHVAATEFPMRVAVDAAGNVWETDVDARTLTRITPAGASTAFALSGRPSDVTTGPDGNVWVSEYEPARVARVTPAGVVTEFEAGGGPIAAGADGALYTIGGDLEFQRVTTAGKVTVFTDRLVKSNTAVTMVPGPGGTLWVGESSPIEAAINIARFDPDRATVDTGAGAGQGDHTRPVLEQLRVTRKRIRFRLSEPARVTLTFARLRAHHKRVRVGTLTLSCHKAGKISRRFRGRIAHHKRLVPGRYRVTAVARDAAHNASAQRPHATLRIKS